MSSSNCPSLFTMAIRNAIRNVDLIDSIGDMPYNMVEPILKHIKSPRQLRELEENSPHVKAHSKDLWLAFIRRDIPRYEQKLISPKNPLNWGGIYRYMLKQDQKAKVEQEEELRKAMQGITDSKGKSTFLPQVVKQVAVQKDFIDGLWNPNKRHPGMPTPRVPTVKNAKAGQFIAALKKEAHESQAARTLAARHAKGEKTRFIPSVKAQIKTAPYALLANHQAPKVSAAMLRVVDSEQSVRRKSDLFAPSFASRESTVKDRALKEAEARECAKREDRLRALANPGAKSAVQSPNITTGTPISRSSAAAATATVTSTQPSRHAPTTTVVHSTGTSATPSSKPAAPGSRTTAVQPPASVQPRPVVAKNATHATPQLPVHGRPMATAKPRLVGRSPSPANNALAASSDEHATDVARVPSSPSTLSPIPMVRKRAPAKLFINHNVKRVKR